MSLQVVVLDDVTVHVNETQEVQAQRRRQPAYHPANNKVQYCHRLQLAIENSYGEIF